MPYDKTWVYMPISEIEIRSWHWSDNTYFSHVYQFEEIFLEGYEFEDDYFIHPMINSCVKVPLIKYLTFAKCEMALEPGSVRVVYDDRGSRAP